MHCQAAKLKLYKRERHLSLSNRPVTSRYLFSRTHRHRIFLTTPSVCIHSRVVITRFSFTANLTSFAECPERLLGEISMSPQAMHMVSKSQFFGMTLLDVAFQLKIHAHEPGIIGNLSHGAFEYQSWMIVRAGY